MADLRRKREMVREMMREGGREGGREDERRERELGGEGAHWSV